MVQKLALSNQETLKELANTKKDLEKFKDKSKRRGMALAVISGIAAVFVYIGVQ